MSLLQQDIYSTYGQNKAELVQVQLSGYSPDTVTMRGANVIKLLLFCGDPGKYDSRLMWQ